MTCNCASTPFLIIKGTTFQTSYPYLQPDGVSPVNITGYSATLDLFETVDAGSPVLSLTSPSGGITFDAPNGLFFFKITVTQTNGLPLMSNGHARLRVLTPGGDTVELFDENLAVFASVSSCGCFPSQAYKIQASGPQGAPGIQGQAGSGASGGSAVAGASISAEMAVVIIGGLMLPANPTNPAHAGKIVGVASQSGITGAMINYQQSGEVPGGSFTQDTFYYVGLNGVLSTTPNAPGAVFTQRIGFAKSISTLVVELDTPILL